MAKCPDCSGPVYRGENFCASCGIGLDWSADIRRLVPPPPKGYRKECPKCHGSGWIDCQNIHPECKEGWVLKEWDWEKHEPCQGTGKIRCDCAGC